MMNTKSVLRNALEHADVDLGFTCGQESILESSLSQYEDMIDSLGSTSAKFSKGSKTVASKISHSTDVKISQNNESSGVIKYNICDTISELSTNMINSEIIFSKQNGPSLQKKQKLTNGNGLKVINLPIAPKIKENSLSCMVNSSNLNDGLSLPLILDNETDERVILPVVSDELSNTRDTFNSISSNLSLPSLSIQLNKHYKIIYTNKDGSLQHQSNDNDMGLENKDSEVLNLHENELQKVTSGGNLKSLSLTMPNMSKFEGNLLQPRNKSLITKGLPLIDKKSLLPSSYLTLSKFASTHTASSKSLKHTNLASASSSDSKKNRRKSKPHKMDMSELNQVEMESPDDADICKECQSPMVTINTGREKTQPRENGDYNDDDEESNSAVDCVMFCLDCTCEKINLLLEENDACDYSSSELGICCRKCFPVQNFASSQDYIEHYLQTHEGREPEFTTEASDEFTLQCGICALYFRTQNDLREHEMHHIGSDMGSNFRCFMCSMECDSIEELTEHQKTHSGSNGPFFCTICDTNFSLPTALKNHILIFHQNLFCQFCHITFKEPKQLDDHLEVCERNTVDGLAGLRNALQSHNDKERFLPYSHTCVTCGKSFRLAWRYKLHQTKAKCLPADKFNSDSDRTCNICNKMFANPMNLHRHELIHAGIRNYSCDLCGKSFVQKTQLDTHLNIHRGIKPFNCEVCNKSFTDRSTFHKHKKIHGKPKSFPCGVCGKVFNQAGYLKLHGKVHGLVSGEPKLEPVSISDLDLC